MQANDSKRLPAFWLAALFLTVLGAKLRVVQLYGSPLPLWDQWYEAVAFFRPWREGHLSWHDFFAPSNEHRIFFTKLLDLIVIQLNGRWEPLLQMTINSVLHSGFACGLSLALWRAFGRQHAGLVCLLVAPFYALPYAGENTIWAINSQSYFVSLFGLAAISGLGFGKPGGRGWWLGAAAAMLGLFTMASGLLAPLAVVGLVVLRALKCRRLESNQLPTLAVGLMAGLIGWQCRVDMPADAPLRAHSVAQFANTFAHNLAWPFIENPSLGLLVLAPLAALVVLYWRRDFTSPRTAEFLLVLALWSGLQSAALAFGRANYGDGLPASRYMDALNLFVIASLMALVLLQPQWPRGRLPQILSWLLPLLFTATVFFGLAKISQIVTDQLLLPTRSMNLVAEERVAAFLTTGDQGELFETPTVRPDPRVTLGVLKNPNLQPILPAACQPPDKQPVAGWLAGIADRLLAHANGILSTGLCLFAATSAWLLLRRPDGGVFAKPVFLVILLLVPVALGFVWAGHPPTRKEFECQLQGQLAAYFKIIHNEKRAVIHERRAAALKN